MDFLDFVRGPALKVSIAIFVAGVFWRLTALALRRRTLDRSLKRPGAPSALRGGLRTIFQRMVTRKPFSHDIHVPYLVAHTFHIGLLIIVVLGTPHILFISEIIGVRWAGLSKGVIDIVSGITFGALLLALFHRLTHPVRRRLSTFDDYLTWTIVVLPVITGLLLTSHLGARYETMLAIHIATFEILLIWFPFGKLMHAFFWVSSRGATGARYSHRGART